MWSHSEARQLPALGWVEATGAGQIPAEVQEFLKAAQGLGLEPVALEMAPARARPRSALDAKPFHVSWWRPWQLRIGSWTLFSLRRARSGRFAKYTLEQAIMPVPAERLALRLKPLPVVEEMAVLVEEKADPILAVRVAGQWFGVHRWLRRPYILSAEELAASRPSRAPR